MSAPEQEQQRERYGAPEGLSSVKLSTTAKGDPQVECKVYSESNDPLDVDRAADQARRIFDDLRREYGIGAHTSAGAS